MERVISLLPDVIKTLTQKQQMQQAQNLHHWTQGLSKQHKINLRLPPPPPPLCLFLCLSVSLSQMVFRTLTPCFPILTLHPFLLPLMWRLYWSSNTSPYCRREGYKATLPFSHSLLNYTDWCNCSSEGTWGYHTPFPRWVWTETVLINYWKIPLKRFSCFPSKIFPMSVSTNWNITVGLGLCEGILNCRYTPLTCTHNQVLLYYKLNCWYTPPNLYTQPGVTVL